MRRIGKGKAAGNLLQPMQAKLLCLRVGPIIQSMSPAADVRSWQLKGTRCRPRAAAAAVAAVVRPHPAGPASSRAALTRLPLAPCTLSPPQYAHKMQHVHVRTLFYRQLMLGSRHQRADGSFILQGTADLQAKFTRSTGLMS